MGNVKAVLIKGKYQFKKQLPLYQSQSNVVAYGLIGETTKKLKPAYINAVLTKKTLGDTHFIIIEDNVSC